MSKVWRNMDISAMTLDKRVTGASGGGSVTLAIGY